MRLDPEIEIYELFLSNLIVAETKEKRESQPRDAQSQKKW